MQHRKLAILSLLGGALGLAPLSCGSDGREDDPGDTSGNEDGGSSMSPGGSGGGGGAGRGGSGGGTSAGGAGGGGGSGTGGAGGSGGSGGNSGSGGSGGSGGGGGSAGAGGAGGARPDAATNPGGRDGGAADARAADAGPRPDGGASPFSFFVVSMKALQTLSGNMNGFGGDLRFGQADGLSGADEICKRAAEMGMPGAGQKTWRAFLSVTRGPNGTPVHARDRIGPGPWHDRNGRLVAANLTDLFNVPRPKGDPMIVNDLPNERGEPNHFVGQSGYRPGMKVDNHDTITGSDTMGRLRATSAMQTCNDWTSASAQLPGPWAGHSWPREGTENGQQWASDHNVANCAAGREPSLGGSGSTIGTTGGYGGFYCFALP